MYGKNKSGEYIQSSVMSTIDKTDKLHNTRQQLASELGFRTGDISINQAYKEVMHNLCITCA